jgi:hypothetical protein
MPTRRGAIGALSVTLPAALLLTLPDARADSPAGVSSRTTDRVSATMGKAAHATKWDAAARHAERARRASRTASPHPFGTVAYNKWWARAYMARTYGWGDDQFVALEQLWERESGWDHRAHNASSGAHGIPQALPGSKMGAFGADWATNPHTQIKWGLDYIQARYGSPGGALSFWHGNHWY